MKLLFFYNNNDDAKRNDHIKARIDKMQKKTKKTADVGYVVIETKQSIT